LRVDVTSDNRMTFLLLDTCDATLAVVDKRSGARDSASVAPTVLTPHVALALDRGKYLLVRQA
jgi:hypothetical protein